MRTKHNHVLTQYWKCKGVFVSFAVSETSGSTLPVTTDQEAVSRTTDEPRSSAWTGRVEVL